MQNKSSLKKNTLRTEKKEEKRKYKCGYCSFISFFSWRQKINALSSDEGGKEKL